MIWTAVDPLKQVVVEYNVQVGSANELVIDRTCRSQYGWDGIAWWVIEYFIRAALLVVMVVLSLLTRRIPNKTFTTSSLRIFSYTSSAVLVIGFTLYYFLLFLNVNPNIEYSILCIMMNVLILLYVTFIFCPPPVSYTHLTLPTIYSV